MNPWQPQVAMAVTQALFVIGSVYLKGSMQNVDSLHGEEFHPIVYAFLREISAGPLLFLSLLSIRRGVTATVGASAVNRLAAV